MPLSREEADKLFDTIFRHEYINGMGHMVAPKHKAWGLVDKIYDNFESVDGGELWQEGYNQAKRDFESRTCSNCKWFADTGLCVNDKGPLCADFVSSDYGCILWESKDD